jgi:ABC-type spermidine/putrescine transport system permease subunit I
MVVTYITLATVIIGFVTALIVLHQSQVKLKEIHVLVNSRLTAVIARVAQLVTVLRIHGIDIPEDKDEEQRENPDVE